VIEGTGAFNIAYGRWHILNILNSSMLKNVWVAGVGHFLTFFQEFGMVGHFSKKIMKYLGRP
jgi:hypothetical protein